MFGFAFSRDEFRIIKMMRGLGVDIPIANNIWFSSSLTSPADRLNCIFATLNAGRILRFYRLSDLLEPEPHPSGMWLIRNNKRLKICYDYVIVEVSTRIDQMKSFYNSIYDNNVPNVERLFKRPGITHPNGFKDGANLHIYLQPKGKMRLPETPIELQTAILDILRCIKYLHTLNYFHTDIRWANIVYYTNSWYLIDCHEFCHITEHDIRVERKRRQRQEGEWEAVDDLNQVLALISDPAFVNNKQFALFLAQFHQMMEGIIARTVDNVIEVMTQVRI